MHASLLLTLFSRANMSYTSGALLWVLEHTSPALFLGSSVHQVALLTTVFPCPTLWPGEPVLCLTQPRCHLPQKNPALLSSSLAKMALSVCFRVQTAKRSMNRAGFGIGAPPRCLFSGNGSESVSYSMCEMCCGLHRGVVKMNEQTHRSNSDQDPVLGKCCLCFRFCSAAIFSIPSVPKGPKEDRGEEKAILDGAEHALRPGCCINPGKKW